MKYLGSDTGRVTSSTSNSSQIEPTQAAIEKFLVTLSKEELQGLLDIFRGSLTEMQCETIKDLAKGPVRLFSLLPHLRDFLEQHQLIDVFISDGYWCSLSRKGHYLHMLLFLTTPPIRAGGSVPNHKLSIPTPKHFLYAAAMQKDDEEARLRDAQEVAGKQPNESRPRVEETRIHDDIVEKYLHNPYGLVTKPTQGRQARDYVDKLGLDAQKYRAKRYGGKK